MNVRLVVLIAAAALLRVGLLAAPGWPFDVQIFASWAQSIVDHGPLSLYYQRQLSVVNYPPGYLLILWLVGIVHTTLFAGGGDAAWRVLLKIPPIAADLAIVALTYHVARRLVSERKALVLAAIVAFAPPLWIDSVLWGQADSVFLVFAFLAFLAAIEGRLIAALPYFTAGILVKPLALVIAPQLLLPYALRGDTLRRFGIGLALSAVLAYAMTVPFTTESGAAIFPFLVARYASPTSAASDGAFSIYPLLTNFYAGDDAHFGPFTFYVWGVAIVALLVCTITISLARALRLRPVDERKTLLRFFGAATLALLALFLFATRMHERYLLPALVFGAPLILDDEPSAYALAGLAFTFTLNCTFVLFGLLNDERNVLASAVARLCCIGNVVAFVVLWRGQLRRLRGATSAEPALATPRASAAIFAPPVRAAAAFRGEILAMLALLTVAIALRFLLMPLPGWPYDVPVFIGWAQSAAAHGPLSLYNSPQAVQVTSLPGYLFVLWAIGSLHAAVGGGDIMWRTLCKLVPALADLAIVVLVYVVGGRLASPRRAFVLAAVVALAPPLWIDSILWGQDDSVVIALAFGALVTAISGRMLGPLPLFAAALLVKPLALSIFPEMILALGANARMLRRYGIALALCAVLAYAATAPFTTENGAGVFAFLARKYVESAQSYAYTSDGAFSFYPLVSNFFEPDTAGFGPFSFHGIGIVAVLASVAAIAVRLERALRLRPADERKTLRRIFGAATLSLLAYFLFATRVHERCLLPVLIFGAPLVLDDRPTALALLWLAVSFTLNFSLVLHGSIAFGVQTDGLTMLFARLCCAGNVAAFVVLWRRQARLLDSEMSVRPPDADRESRCSR